jgi:hypothetical protein
MTIVAMYRLVTGILALAVLIVIAYRRGGRSIETGIGKGTPSQSLRSRRESRWPTY